ncbi:unnamed protein product, partial [Ascophyllum nodosum]
MSTVYSMYFTVHRYSRTLRVERSLFCTVLCCVAIPFIFWTPILWTHQPGSHRISPPRSLSLVDRKVEFLCIHELIVLHYFLLGMMRGKIPLRVTAPRFELTSQR